MVSKMQKKSIIKKNTAQRKIKSESPNHMANIYIRMEIKLEDLKNIGTFNMRANANIPTKADFFLDLFEKWTKPQKLDIDQ